MNVPNMCKELWSCGKEKCCIFIFKIQLSYDFHYPFIWRYHWDLFLPRNSLWNLTTCIIFYAKTRIMNLMNVYIGNPYLTKWLEPIPKLLKLMLANICLLSSIWTITMAQFPEFSGFWAQPKSRGWGCGVCNTINLCKMTIFIDFRTYNFFFSPQNQHNWGCQFFFFFFFMAACKKSVP